MNQEEIVTRLRTVCEWLDFAVEHGLTLDKRMMWDASRYVREAAAYIQMRDRPEEGKSK